MKTIIEPFRIKVVEPLTLSTPQYRERCLREADYNLFRLGSDDVLIDLLTDSGTSAMSSLQWSAMMRGDESYAGSPSFERFRTAAQDLTGYRHVIPTHQGRAAERILFEVTAGPGKVVPGNRHFDTTRANIEHSGATALDLPIPEDSLPSSRHPFKGNVDLQRLEALLTESADDVPLVLITVTSNSGGGQPVSLANLRAASDLCRRHGVPLLLDACRFAENAYLVRQREPGRRDSGTRDIAREMFSLADGCTFSAKKDGLANIGGFLALNDEQWARQARDNLILTEGFPTYGGLAGRDLEAIAQGLQEVLHEDYLAYRVRSVAYLGEKLRDGGVPIVEPPGGHAVFVDAREMLAHIPPWQYPAVVLANALYVEGGIRGVEIGTLMFGRPREDGHDEPADLDLLRLTLPRRVYTQSHVDYVAEALLAVHQRKEDLRGLRIVGQEPVLRHFTARLAPVDDATSPDGRS